MLAPGLGTEPGLNDLLEAQESVTKCSSGEMLFQRAEAVTEKAYFHGLSTFNSWDLEHTHLA